METTAQDPKPEGSGLGESMTSGTTHEHGIREKDHATTDGHIESLAGGEIEPELRDFLMARHGTVDLIPLPTMDPVDPLNWPAWKKNLNLFLVAFHAMMTTFTAACIIPAFELFALDFHISITQASYLTSVQILILGLSSLFWKPISNRFGRRPIWLVSTFGSMICNIGCAESHSYASQMISRILVAFFICPAMSIGSAVVTETFFARERAQKMGIWTLMVTLGPPIGPFIMGFVAFHTGGWTWIYWILAIVNGVEFLLYFFFSPETLYDPNMAISTQTSQSAFRRSYLNFSKKGPSPITLEDVYAPLKLALYPNILIPTISYSFLFGFASVLLTVEIPQLFTPKFHLNTQQIGLQFLGMIIGSVIGEQIGGRGSDWWMLHSSSKPSKTKPNPEHRLWISYPGFLCSIIGLVVFCIQTDNLDHYNVTPILGIAIAAFGLQIVTTVLVTYTVDCQHEHAASIGAFVNLVRSTWGFIGPFWFPRMFAELGLRGSAGLIVGLVVLVSVLPVVGVQVLGRRIRQNRGESEAEG
ncbi:hypothetical protein B7494_g3225 [Chlorociboria aeruginascens]|nr:hypothetical protein B7494_g3225 [Chlorociboria aeruginascens]